MVKEIDNYKWTRVPEDSPDRCQAVTSQGQCRNIRVEGSEYCLAHGGNKAAHANKKKRMDNYRLGKFHARAQELGESQGINSLRDEVALMRMIIEEKVKQCNDSHDLLLVSGPLSDLLIKTEKLVTSMNRLESRLGQHLDKTKIIQFAQIMIEIIDGYIDDAELLDKIGADFFTAIGDI